MKLKIEEPFKNIDDQEFIIRDNSLDIISINPFIIPKSQKRGTDNECILRISNLNSGDYTNIDSFDQ